MYEAAQMLNIGMVVFFIATFVSVSFLIHIHRNEIIKNQETRIKLGKILSVTPLALNLGLLIGFLCIFFLQNVVSSAFIIIAMFVILYGSGLSAVMGGAIALLGLYFSISYIKTKNSSKKYIVFSITSIITSSLFLVVYLIVLIPISMNYYGL